MEVRNMFERGDIALSLANAARQDEIDLVTRTIFGTPGGTLYRHLDTPGRINHQQDPYFLSLRKGGRLMGVVGFSHRILHQPAGPADAFYVRYLSMNSNLQRKDAHQSNAKSKSGGFIKKMITRVMNRPYDLYTGEGPGPKEAFFYAFVEMDNARSSEMTESMGFSPVGEFSTLPFSRFKPKADPRVHLATPEVQPEITEKVTDFYRNHALFTAKNLFLFPDSEYFVFKDGDKIVGGLGAMACHWVVQEMPGFSGKMIMKMLPRTPFMSKLFNPSAFRFISVDGLWWADGYEDTAFSLIETALKHFGLHTSLLWMDRKSKVNDVIRNGKIGILHRFNSDTPASVIVRNCGVSEQIIDDLKSRPLYISSFDSV